MIDKTVNVKSGQDILSKCYRILSSVVPRGWISGAVTRTKKTKISVEKATVSRKYRFCKEINFLLLSKYTEAIYTGPGSIVKSV